MRLTYEVKEARKKQVIISAMAEVEDIVGDISKGMHRFGLTAGQFSLCDLIDHILRQIGPADMYLTTWAASTDGLKRAFDFLKDERVKKIKFLIDVGCKKVRDQRFSDLIDSYGDSIRTTKIHAKFVIFRNENWDIVVRTSANLNRNQRIESFEIDENREFADFMQTFFDEAFKVVLKEDNYNVRSSRKLSEIMAKSGEKEDEEFNFDNLLDDMEFDF